ncbi:MAG: serine protease [Acidobacteriia bacterium]|nr:serine protease [Terriglobia bacterium]
MRTHLRLSSRKAGLVFAIFLASLTSSYALGESLPDTIDKLRPAIIRVMMECTFANAAKPKHWAGTGFLVSREGFALTAAHVLKCPTSDEVEGTDSPQPLTAHRVLVGIPVMHMTDQTHTRRNFTYLEAEVIESDSIHDVALLKLSQNPFRSTIDSGYTLNGRKLDFERPGIALLSTRKPREGEPIAVSGYPLLRDNDQPVFDTMQGLSPQSTVRRISTCRPISIRRQSSCRCVSHSTCTKQI